MLELAFYIAICWAVARAFDHTRSSVSRHVAARRQAVPEKHKRAAARQAATGWWVSEVLHGFPHFRHGWAAGWHDHQDVRGNARVATARRKAERAERGLGWQAEIAAYLHRLEIAAARREQGPNMSDQLRAILARMRERWDGQQQPAPGADDPGTDPGTGRPRQRPDESLQDLRERLTAPAPTQPPGPGPNGGQPVTTPNGSPSSGEPTFHSVNELCDQAVQEAESVAGPHLEACATLPDNLGAVIRDDSDMMGKSAELAAAARAFESARRRILDAAQAVKDHNLQHYAPHQDASDSTGVTPERAYTAAG
jgi:hypothetical protein